MSDYSAKPVRAPEVVMDDPNKKLQEVLDYLKYSYVKSSGYKGTVRARARSRAARSRARADADIALSPRRPCLRSRPPPSTRTLFFT